MPHTIEPASSGRSKCRACGSVIAKDELRFGERLPNPFADGEMTLWFHPLCAAYRRPESLLEFFSSDQAASTETAAELDGQKLRQIAEQGVTYHRLERISGVQRAPSGRARCRNCRETIAKDDWRIPLMFFEEGMFNSSGFVHARCAAEYFETADVITRLQHFSEALEDDDVAEIQTLLGAP